MKFCVSCGKQIDDSVAFCPYCGAQQPQLQQEPQPQPEYQPQPQQQYQPQPQPQFQPQQQYQYQQPPQAANAAAQKVKSSATLFWGPENELYKAQHQFGGLPSGTLEIYPDHIDVYINGKSNAWAYFGLVGAIKYLAGGKGKHTATVTYDMITAYKNPRKYNYVLYLNDGNLLFLFLEKKAVATFEAFLAGKPVIT